MPGWVLICVLLLAAAGVLLNWRPATRIGVWK
jgi:hypothetical protein